VAEVAQAYVTLLASARGFERSVSAAIGSQTERAGRQAGGRAGRAFGASFGKVTGGVLAGLGLAQAGGAALGFLKDANAEAQEARKVGALTEQVIRSTGGAANVTADQVGNLAAALSNKVGVDDEAIQSGANLILTFKNVRNELGKGNQIFDRANEAALNLSAAGFGDLRSTSLQVGKALNDPLKGLTALGRAGVTFTAAQKKQIKALVESNRTLDAQKIILAEIESQVGGAAEAQVTASDKASVAFGNLKEQIGTALLPTVDRLATFSTDKLIPAISGFVTGLEDGTGLGGDFADALGTIKDVGEGVVRTIDALPGPVKEYGVQLAIAAVAVNKLSVLLPILATKAKVAGFGLAAAATQTGGAAAAFGRVATAARGLAGPAGLVAIGAGAQESDEKLGALLTTAGAAATGFAVGGPVGAAIGGTAGLIFSLAKNTRDSGDAAREAVPGIQSYIDTLGTGRDVITDFTRQLAVKNLTETGAFGAARELGIAQSTVTRAALGSATAQAEIAKAVRKARAEYAEASKTLDGATVSFSQFGGATVSLDPALSAARSAATRLSDSLKLNQDDLRESIIKTNEAALAAGDYSEVLAGVPKKAATKIDQIGLSKARQNIIGLTRDYNLTPKQVETVLIAAGAPLAKNTVQDVINKARELDRQRPTVKISADKAEFDRIVGSIRSSLSNLPLLGVTLGATTPRRRAIGGPLGAGQTALVGERGPELFTATQSGRITSTNALRQATGEQSRTTILRVGDREFVAYLEEVADSRVGAASAIAGMYERAL